MRAFTLVELLIVIGIIALLMGILLPVLGRAREQAKSVKCLSNLRQISMATQGYINENRGALPAAGGWSANPNNQYCYLYWQANAIAPMNDVNQSPIAPYLGIPVNEEVLRCPSDDPKLHAGQSPLYPYSYTMNLCIGSSGINTIWWRITQINNVSDKILFVDEDERTINDTGWLPTVDWLCNRHDRKFAVDNLNGRGNVAYCDGHAQVVTRGDTVLTKHYEPLE